MYDRSHETLMLKVEKTVREIGKNSYLNLLR